jgi:hypothetical protein
LIFLFFPKMFAESQILHTAREPEEWLMARNPLPTEFCRECFAGGYSRQSFCREWTGLYREEPTHCKEVVYDSDWYMWLIANLEPKL